MKEVSQNVYEENFDKIHDWFQCNVHVATPGHYMYKLIPLEDDYRRMCDIVSDKGSVHFRVIIKATNDQVKGMKTPTKDYRDIHHFFNTATNPPLTYITATQVCYVQLDAAGDPLDGALVTYSHDTGTNTLFPL